MVRQTTKVILLEILGVISLLLMTVVGVLAFMLASGPVGLGIFKDDVAAALSDARNGRVVDIDTLSLQWMPSERRLFVAANGVTLRDAQGESAGYAQIAELTLDAGAALTGRVELLGARLDQGWLDVRHDGVGNWTIAGDPLPDWQASAMPETPQAWLARINEVLQQTLGSAARLDAAIKFERTAFENFEVRYTAPQIEPTVLLQAASGTVERSSAGLQLAIQGESEVAFLPQTVGFELAISPDYSELVSRLDVGVLPLGEIVRVAGVGGAFEGDMQVDTGISARVSAANGLTEVNLTLDHDSGDLLVPHIAELVQALDADIQYRPQDDVLVFEQVAFRSGRVQTDFSGRIEQVLTAPSEQRRVIFEAPRLSLNLQPVLEEVLTFQNISFSSAVDADFRGLSNAELKFDQNALSFSAGGDLVYEADVPDGHLPVSAKVEAEFRGEAAKADILALWPVELGKGGRRFVEDRVESAVLTQANAVLDLQPDSFLDGYLRDEDLQVTFSYRDGVVQFLTDLPAVSKAFGNGMLGGNSFSINAVESAFDDWDLQLVEVDFPQLNPRGNDFTVTAIGGGDVQSIYRNVSNSRLQLEARSGFSPDRLQGAAKATFYMRRPALSQVPLEDIQIQVKGQISEGGLQEALGELDLVEARADVDITQDRIIVNGFGDVGESPVQFTWRDAFQDDGGAARLSASSIITPDFLNAFGLTGRAFLTGEIPVEIQAQIAASGVEKADVAFDLKEARIDLSEMGWVKPVGEVARASVQYAGEAQSRASTIKVQSERASLDGDIRLSDTGQLQALQLRRLFIEDMADVSGAITRRDDQRMSANISGPFLNISSFISQLGGLGATTSGASNDDMLPLLLSAQVEKLRLRRDLELLGSQLQIDSTERGLNVFAAKGRIAGGGNIDVRLKPKTPGGPLTIRLSSSDAGFMAGAFFGIDFIEGGEMQVDGTLGTAGAPTQLLVKFFDTRLTNAPFFTQILSLASLRGLTDTLSGEGVLFTRVEAPIQIGGGRYVIDGARASGPALGLTANGWVGVDGKGLELDGVLVPSFGVNSMLGGVPIIGDLLVGRDGEGIFSITYSVRGSLEKAQVAVNPLSAVTPGILRRIFENPSDTSIPAQLPVAPGRLPPSAKLPDLPDEELLEPLPDN